jgi:serine/threonine protein kinase
MTPLTHSRGRLCDLQPNDEVLIGDTPYFVKSVAKGGMGLVFLLDQDSDRAPQRFNVHGLRVALKTILPDFLTNESKDMFHRELAVWAAFRHPNVVALNEILDGGPDGWIAAMDRCLGSLRDHLTRSNKLSLKEATNIVGDILDGLAYAYDRNQVLHLDLKPENVLYNWDIRLAMRRKEARDSEKWRFMLSD